MLTIFNKQNSNKASDVESNLKPMTLESAKEYYKAVDISTVKNRTPAIVVGKVISTRLVPMAIVLMKGLAQMDKGEMTIANPYYQIL